MEDQAGNTSRRLTPQKRAFSDSKSKWDEEGVEKKRCKYESDDGSKREMSEKRASSQSTTKQKRQKGDHKNWEIIGRQDVFDKHIFYKRSNAYEDKMNLLINSREKICTFLKSVGLDENNFLKDFTQRIEILQKDIKKNDYSQDFIIIGKLEWFLEQYIKTNVLQDKHKTIEIPKIYNKFRPLCPVMTREAKINESGEEFDKSMIISNIIVIQRGVITYSHHCMTVCCVTRDGDRNYVHCPSSVTDFTRIGQDTVLATLPFRKLIIIINPSSFNIKTLQFGFFLISYLEYSTLIGVEMFGKTVYQIDWEDNRIITQFIAKETPANIAVGPQGNLLIAFANINRVTCYILDGQQLFEVETHSLNLPTNITVYQNHFYVLQGQIIYRISAKGGVTMRDIGRKCRYFCVCSDIIFLTDYFGVLRIIRKTKDFWFKSSYCNQLCTSSLINHIYIEDFYNVKNILPMSTSSILILYGNKKATLFSDNAEIISHNYLTFNSSPSALCRLNSNRFLVFYHEMKGFQCITCPELRKGPLIKVQTDYIEICHIVSNKCLAVTTTENKNEIHILLIKEDKVDIIERISLGHYNVTIAATPINFVVVDRRENKMVFYSTCGEELFQKYLSFYGCPHHIYSDNVYFYVLFKRHSILICYDIYGEMKWQWQLPFPVHPHIAVFQGTVYLPDTQLNRVLFYKYQDRSSGCCLHLKNPYIRNLNLRLKEKEKDKKLVIGEICNLANGQLVVSDINHDCLLYISNEGDIVSRLSLPSTATDICQWDSHQIGVTLPLQKQLRVIGNLSKTVRSVSLGQPYVRVCKMGEGEIVCYCDKPSHLDILAINYYNQVETIKTINIPFFVKSLAIEIETPKLLIVTRKIAFQYNTSNCSGGGYSSSSSSKMVPSVLMSQVKRPPNLYGGSIDKMFIYLIDNSRMFAINDHNLLVNDLVTNNQLNIYINLMDVFSRKICVSEMLSSSLYVQDLTVSDKARHVAVPPGFGDKYPVYIRRLCVIENNLIASYDWKNKNIKIFTFDGQLVDSIKLNVFPINMCRWQSKTLVITTYGAKCQLLTLKVEFPLLLVTYLTGNEYKCIASLSNNQLVCSRWGHKRNLYVIVIDEKHSTVNIIKQMDIPETLTKDRCGRINYICNIIVTANDVIIISNRRFIISFNSDGQYLYSVRHYMAYDDIKYNNMTIDDSYLYIYGWWDRYGDFTGYNSLVCLTQTGEYNRIFINSRIYKDKVDFTSFNCNGPRFAGSHNKDKLYVEGLFKLIRERFPVARLQTDEFAVQVKDFDISDEGKTVVCEKANNGNVKIFDEDGELLCHRDVGSLVGGVCFTQGKHIMATVPNRREIFKLKQQDLEIYKVWESLIPYGVIWRKVGGIYWCQHIELIECHCIKIDGDQVKVLESVSLLNLDSGLHFPSITSETNKEIFSNDLINKLKYSGGDGGRRGESGKIISKGRIKVRCGNYIAESISGTDEISVRRLPYRTAMVPLSIPTCTEPVNYDIEDSRDYNSKLIKLDENVSVLMFRESVTLINTMTGDILQHKQLLQQQPLDICWWTDECFIVAFGEQLMFFNRDLCCLKTIRTEKFYNRIYKYNDNQLVCGGGHYIEDMTECRRCWSSYYVDVVAIDGEICKYIHKVCSWLRKKVEIEVVLDIVVTSGGDIVVVKEERERSWSGYAYDVIWFSEHLVRSIKLPRYLYNNIHRHYLTTHGKYVYIVDRYNNIYQIPGHIEHQTSEDIQQYLLLRGIDNEVYKVLGFDVSENSLMVFGIIPGCQSFAFFHYDR